MSDTPLMDSHDRDIVKAIVHACRGKRVLVIDDHEHHIFGQAFKDLKAKDVTCVSLEPIVYHDNISILLDKRSFSASEFDIVFIYNSLNDLDRFQLETFGHNLAMWMEDNGILYVVEPDPHNKINQLMFKTMLDTKAYYDEFDYEVVFVFSGFEFKKHYTLSSIMPARNLGKIKYWKELFRHFLYKITRNQPTHNAMVFKRK